jgi:hypothetical protein
MSAFTIIRLSDDALPKLGALFESVFGHPVSPELLRWKYADQRGESWAIELDGNIVLHCGLLFRRVTLRSREYKVAQLVDLMAAPKRSGLSRNGAPFPLLMDHILKHLPHEENPDGIAFGFPSDRAMRLGEHADVYQSIDTWFLLRFRPRQMRFAPSTRPWDAGSSEDQALASHFWLKMRDSLSHLALGDRGIDYLHHRYLKHPEKSYRLLVILSAWRKKPIGLAVLSSACPEPEILDLIGDFREMPQMLLALQCSLAAQSCSGLTLFLTDRPSRQLMPFADERVPTEFRIMTNPRTPARIKAQLSKQWWLTGGDTDYR